MAGEAPRSVARDVEDIETITSGLTRTILGDDAVNATPTVATSAGTDEIDAITNRLREAILGEDENQRLVTTPAEEEKAAEGENQGAKPVEVESTENKASENASRPKAKEGEDAINALDAACSNWFLEDDEEAEARREAERLKEQVRVKHEEKMRALEIAEDKRRNAEALNAFERNLQADIDKARLSEMKRRTRKEKDEGAARQLRAQADAEKLAVAERKAAQERRAQEEALALHAKREADDRAKQELLEVYNGIFLHNAAIAEANALQVQVQRQHEAELIAQYHGLLAQQAQQAQLRELERQQQEQQFLQQQYAHSSNRQVPDSAEEMDTAPEAEVGEPTEMDTAPEMEASGGDEMEWELEEAKSRLPTESLPPSSQPAPGPSALAQGLPSPDPSLATAMEIGNKAQAENSSPHSSSQSAMMAPSAVSATPEPAAGVAAPVHLSPRLEPSKVRRIDTRSKTSAASPVSPQTADQAATPQPSIAPAPSPAAVPPVVPAPASQSLAVPAVPAIPAAPADPAVPVAPVAPAAPTSPSASVALAVPVALAVAASRSPPPPPMPAPFLTPSSARPAPSNQRTLKIVCKRHSAVDPALAAIRPTVNAWSPLGRLLSQLKAIPKVTMTQVLGKRARENGEEGGRDNKKPKFEGEFRFQVGGKRKREGEEFPGKKRAFLSRTLAVPCSRFAASQGANSAVPPPILTPNSTHSNHQPTPSPPTPFAAPPPALEPLQANPHRGLAEAIELYNDLPSLRREIAWMRAQRQIATSRKETRGNRSSTSKKATKGNATQGSYWSKYRENLSR